MGDINNVSSLGKLLIWKITTLFQVTLILYIYVLWTNVSFQTTEMLNNIVFTGFSFLQS